jgi:hypothetical protein
MKLESLIHTISGLQITHVGPVEALKRSRPRVTHGTSHDPYEL